MMGAWCLLVQLSAKMPRRGDLVKDGVGLDAEDISVNTGMPQDIVSLMLQNCSSDKINWIEVIECEKYAPLPLGYHSDTTTLPEQQEQSPATGQDKTRQEKTREEEEGGSLPGDLSDLMTADGCIRAIKALSPVWAKKQDGIFVSALQSCPDGKARAQAVMDFLVELRAMEQIPKDFPMGRFRGFMRNAAERAAKASAPGGEDTPVRRFHNG
jgi:hypothetical protein